MRGLGRALCGFQLSLKRITNPEEGQHRDRATRHSWRYSIN
jgi:hypothetical protein